MNRFHPAIYCPLCCKTSVRMDYDWITGMARYLHLWKRRDVWHTVVLKSKKTGRDA